MQLYELINREALLKDIKKQLKSILRKDINIDTYARALLQEIEPAYFIESHLDWEISKFDTITQNPHDIYIDEKYIKITDDNEE